MARIAWPRFRTIAWCAAAAILLLAATASYWLPAPGRWLVREDAPSAAGMVVVLGGDVSGARILAAGDLVRKGLAPAVLVSGPPGYFGLHECELSIPLAVRRGYPRDWFIPMPNEASSTRTEAALVVAELRRRGVRKFLLVTSDFHTARAGMLFRAAARRTGGGLALDVVGAPSAYRADTWWKTAVSRRIFVGEWARTAGAVLGL